VSAEKALGYLKALLEGVQATERVLLKVRRDTGGGVSNLATAWQSCDTWMIVQQYNGSISHSSRTGDIRHHWADV
jgi:hypothetical protein